MALDNEGVNIIITGDASQALKAIKDTQQATESLKDQSIDVKVDAKVDALGRLHKANGQFMTMGEKLASQFSSAFMKKAAELAVQIDGWGKNLEATFGTAFKTITAGATAVAGVFTMIARSALAVGGGFESQMTTVKVISGATGEELEQLTAKAREMGATLPITAKDAATAMTLLAQRGTSAKDILASVTDVANLAISQGVSMGAAADLLGSTMTNFGIAIDDAAKVTAIFNNASNQSALNMSKLTEALKYVGPTAGSVGMELTEAISGMEALANAGLTGEMIGTGFAMVLTKISTKARIMGVETKDLQGNLRPLADIFSELQSKGFSLAEATAIFGARGRLAALNLAKQSAALKENQERLKNWGSTQAAVDEKAKTFTNTMMALSSAIEAIHIEIFEQIKTQSKGAVSGVTELVRTLSEWVGQSKIAEKALNSFLEGLRFNIPAGTDFKKFLEQLDVQAIVEKVKSFGATIRSIADSIASFASKIKTPLLFLIKHLDTFATISFWGWITGKAMQIPAIIISLASSFMQLASAVKTLSAINFSNIITFLNHPALLTIGVAAYGMYKAVSFSNAASESLRKAMQEEKSYLREQAKADSSLEFDIQLNVKTGFEKLPESWIKASDELREQANVTVQALQDAFKNNVEKSIDTVTAKFPDMAEALKNSAEVMSNSSLRKITQALQGNKEAFNELPEHIKKVAEELYHMEIRAGQVTGSIGDLIIAWKKLQKDTGNLNTPDEFATFAQEITASINSLINEIPDNIERLQKFLGGHDLELPVNVSLAQANKQLQELSKSIGEKFNIPQEIVSSAIFSRLQTLADKGNTTAQSLRNGWNNSTQAFDNFLATVQDAIKYLGASPEKFSPALNSLVKGFQKIDPLTGKVTEQFKKAYDALKQWSNITFDQLAQRIQRIRKAVEGGFIDQSALNAEFERVSKQVKLQVVTELQPSRSSYQSQEAFNSVVASEYVSRMGELGGQAFMDLLQREFASLYDKSGSAIGAAIIRQVDKGLEAGKASIKINGVEMFNNNSSSQNNSEALNLAKTFSESFNPLISKLEQFTSRQTSSENSIAARFPEIVSAVNKLTAGIDNNSSVLGRANDAILSLVNSIGNIKPLDSANLYSGSKDYSSELSQVIKEIQSVSAGISALQSISQDNISAVNGVEAALSAVKETIRELENTIKTQQDNSTNLDASSVSQSIINAFNPFLARFDNNTSLYQAATSELTKNLLDLQHSLDTLKISTDNNINALTSAQYYPAQSEGTSSAQNISDALAPLISAVQVLNSTAANIQSTNQGHTATISSILSAVKNVESAIKSIDAGNNYNIDIRQQGFNIQKRSDANLVANNTVSAIRSGLGNGGV